MRKRWDEIMRRLQKNPKAVAAEIGVDFGKLSKRLLQAMPLLTLYMIDRWCTPPKGDSYLTSGSELSQRGEKYFEKAYHMSVEIAMKYKSRAHIIRPDYVKAAEQFADGFFDLVFIDGDHSYDGCKRDIIAWLSKVKKGGFICGHDYAHPDQGQVKKAVDEIFEKDKIKLADNRTWFVRL